MAQPYVGEIRIFAGNFSPAGWQFCDGSLLPISEYETLFNLIGTTYGGDGESTFGVPDLRGRVPIHMGQGGGLTNRVIGESGGSEEVTLTVQQMPSHNHVVGATTNLGTMNTPGGNLLSQTQSALVYRNGNPTVPMATQSVTIVGGSQPHTNLQPSVGLGFIISLFGIYPSPT